MSITKKRILVIDDNEDISNMTKIMLEMKDYTVSVKTNTIFIEDYIKEFLPDLIIMDMLLSGTDGREVCRSLKSSSDLGHLSILMMSAHPHARQGCLEAGADYFLEKPFDIQGFYQAVEKVLSK